MPTSDEEDNNKQALRVFQKFLLIVTSASVGSFKYIISPTLIHLAIHVNEAIFTVPYIFLTRSIGYVGGSILGNLLYQRILYTHHKNLVIFFATLLMAVTGIIISLSRHLTLLLALFCIIGACMAAIDTGFNAICLHSNMNVEAPFFLGLFVFESIGAVFPGLFFVSYAEKSYRNILWKNFIQNASVTKYDSTLTSIKSMPFSYKLFSYLTCILSFLWLAHYLLKVYNSLSPMAASEGEKEEESLRFSYVVIAISSILSFISGCIENGYLHVLPVYSMMTYQMSHVQSIEVLLLFLGFYILARLLTIMISFWINSHNLLFIGAVMILIGTILLYMDMSEMNFWIFNALVGMGTGPLFPMLIVWLCNKVYITHRRILWLFIMNFAPEMVMPLIMCKVLCWRQPIWLRGFMLTFFIAYFLLLAFLYILMQLMDKSLSRMSDLAEPEILHMSPWRTYGNVQNVEQNVEEPSTSQQTEINLESSDSSPGALLSSLEELKSSVNETNSGVMQMLQRLDEPVSTWVTDIEETKSDVKKSKS